MIVSFDHQFIQGLSQLIPEPFVEEVRAIRFPPEEILEQLFLLTTNLQHVLRQHGKFGQAAMVAEYINPKIEQIISERIFPASERSEKHVLDESVPLAKRQRTFDEPESSCTPMETEPLPSTSEEESMVQGRLQLDDAPAGQSDPLSKYRVFSEAEHY